MIGDKSFFITLLLTCASFSSYACGPGDVSSNESLIPLQQNSIKAKVTNVIDGVTIEVSIENRLHRIRYLGIKLPSSDIKAQHQLLVANALHFNRFLVSDSTVELVRDNVDTDINGDLIRYVYVNGEMINKAIITNGHAVVDSYPRKFKYLEEFLVAESNARNSRRGVWNTLAPESEPANIGVGRFGSTLPSLNSLKPNAECDYSNDSNPVIKGNVNPSTGERTYHIPGTLFYNTTRIDEANGDRLFCTESEALESGWMRSHR